MGKNQHASEYYRDNASRLRAYSAEHYAENRERYAETRATYYQNHKAEFSARTLMHRAKVAGAKNIEFILPTAIFERDRWTCHLCGKKVHKSKATLDHIVPLSKGGDHTVTNVALAHRRCNNKKQATGNAQLRLPITPPPSLQLSLF